MGAAAELIVEFMEFIVGLDDTTILLSRTSDRSGLLAGKIGHPGRYG